MLLINTCSVREKAEDKVYSLLGEWRSSRRRGPHVLIGVGGCVASQEGEAILARAPFVDLVFGPQTLHRLPEMLGATAPQRPHRRSTSASRRSRSSTSCRRRGAERRRGLRLDHGGLQPVLQLLRRALHPRRGDQPARSSRCSPRCVRSRAQGVREVTLLGQNVNAYAGRDGGRRQRRPRDC